MTSHKKLGLFCTEEKITVVEFEKNAPLQVLFLPLPAPTDTNSPFSSHLTEEIQMTEVLKKILQDNHVKDGSFYVSLPMKEIILRSFVIPFLIPFVNQENLENAVKYEAKKYIPFDIQDMLYVYHTIPFAEGQNKRLQVIFFAVRKEAWDRYERIFKQVNIEVSCCEPYTVSLSKALLFAKEIKPTEHVAFLTLDKSTGRICFIDKGIPQFIREFPISLISPSQEIDGPPKELDLKIVTEVLNSFDFYARQFSGESVTQMLIASQDLQQGLMEALEAELKIKIRKYSSTITTGALVRQNSDMDAIYAMGACVTSPMGLLSKFNFIGEKAHKPGFNNVIMMALRPFKVAALALLACIFFLGAAVLFFQVQLKLVQAQYDRVAAKEGAFLNQPQENIQAEIQQNIGQLNQYKNIRTKSDVAFIILKLASHLPAGTLLSSLKVVYDQGDSTDARVAIDMQGMVVNEDLNVQMAVVNQLFMDFKGDKELARFIKNVKLVSLSRQQYHDRQVTGFVIHFS